MEKNGNRGGAAAPSDVNLPKFDSTEFARVCVSGRLNCPLIAPTPHPTPVLSRAFRDPNRIGETFWSQSLFELRRETFVVDVGFVGVVLFRFSSAQSGFESVLKIIC